MNVAETYLRRGEVSKTANLLMATLNHSYSTNVWREEIRVDKTLPRACPNSTSNRNLDNQMGTGDMPEAWGNANMVNLLRDMLLLEQSDGLHLLQGIPADWIGVGQEIVLRNAPTTVGGVASLRLWYPAAGKFVLEFDPPPQPIDLTARFPLPDSRAITSVRVNGQAGPAPVGPAVKLENVHAPVNIEVEFR